MFFRLLRRLGKTTRLVSLISAPLMISFFGYDRLNTLQLQQHHYKEPIFLSHALFLSDILGNRTKFFFLVVYKDRGGQGEREAIKVGKRLAEMNEELNQNVNVYIISRPSLNDISKVVNRVKGIQLFQEEDSKDLEIYLKSTYSEDYLFVPYNASRFFQPQKQEKLKKKINKIMNLFHFVHTPEELCRYVHENYYKLDNPILIKTSHGKTKPQQKSLKYYKKACFNLMERKLLNNESQFLIINEDLAKQLGLEWDDIFILRNDVLQKYYDSAIYEKDGFTQMVPQLKLEPHTNPDSLIQFIRQQGDTLKTKLEATKDSEAKEQNSRFKEFLGSLQTFVLPRVLYMHSQRRSQVGQLLKKMQLCKDKDHLVLSLQLHHESAALIENQARLINFFKLYEEFASKKILFMIEDLIPHLNYNHANFCLFNIFNQQTHKDSLLLMKRVTHPYEKYFLRDERNYIEEYDNIKQQVVDVVSRRTDRPVDYISYDQDRITEGFPRVQKRGDIIHMYHPSMMGNAIKSVLQSMASEHSHQKIFRVASRENHLIVCEEGSKKHKIEFVTPPAQNVDLVKLRQLIDEHVKQQ